MRWEDGRESDNVEDDRDGSGGGSAGFGFGGRSIGIGTLVVALVGGWVLGINPLTLLGLLDGGGAAPTAARAPAPAHAPPANDMQAKFVAVILGSTEDVWRSEFQMRGATYHDTKLRLYRGTEQTGCGLGQSAAGPFYCPQDQKVYIDLGFYDLLRERFKAPGEFAQAYVIAHEVGHHVQNQLGVMRKLEQARGRASEAQYNALSVRVELQADCFAGVWAKKSDEGRKWLDPSDFAQALRAAAAIGDDTLQKQARGRVVPESFTHGTSEQRVHWLTQGFETGRLEACDTFSDRT